MAKSTVTGKLGKILTSEQQLFGQAWRMASTVRWLALRGFTFNRHSTAVLFALLGIALVLQASLAMSLVLSSQLMTGQDIQLPGLLHWRIEDRTTANALAFSLILGIMLLYALTTYFTSLQLRALGRAIHIDNLKKLLGLAAETTELDDQKPADLNRLFYQSALHAALAVEGLFRMAQPLFIISSASYAILRLDPALLPLIAVLGLPMLPVLARESRRLVARSEAFYGSTAQGLSRSLAPFLKRTRDQNAVPLNDDAGLVLSNGQAKAYFDDYDAVLLANERMSLITGVYRPIVMVAVLAYLAMSQAHSNSGQIAILPILFAIFYLSAGLMAMASNVTNLMRLLPQVRLVRAALEQKEAPLRSTEPHDPPAIIKWAAGERILCALGGPADRTRVLQLTLSLVQENSTSAAARQPKIEFVGKAFSCIGLRVTQLLPAGVPSDVLRQNLTKLGATQTLHDLLLRPDARIDEAVWETMNSDERLIMKIMPMLGRSASDVRLVEFDHLFGLAPTRRSALLQLFSDKPLLLNFGVSTPPADIASQYILLTPNHRVRYVSYDAFVAENIRTGKTSEIEEDPVDPALLMG